MKFWLVIPAAGIGSRMGADKPKQYVQVAGKSILEHSLAVFLQYPQLQAAVVALAADDPYWDSLSIAQHPQVHPVTGGKERADSVLAGLHYLTELGAQPNDWVLVHDAARPLLTRADLDRLLQTLAQSDVGGLLACPVRDTLKQDDGSGLSAKTLNRDGVWQALTPQMFQLQLLTKALTDALSAGAVVTDEASAVEWAGYSPQLVLGRSDNLKLTYPEDVALFGALYSQAQQKAGA